ncbi:MAG: hypothetical protein JXQ65_00725 [Candidatus Marinimicrobia bacterium]|nr:hypothetical protein [Candidatus Neomarinimicrobiota bacterium]
MKIIETPFGILSQLSHKGITYLYSDNIMVYNSESFEHSEELVHFVCSAHEKPQNILLIGHADPLILKELSKYEHIRKILAINECSIFQNLGWDLDSNPCFAFLQGDPPIIINTLKEKFDIITLNVPEPVNLKWNRFYTSDFLKKINPLLEPKGIFQISISGSETFLSSEKINFIKILYNTMAQNFSHVTIIPGETIHFLCSEKEINLKEFEINPTTNHFVNHELLSDRLSSFKIDFLYHKIKSDNTKEINTLLRPKGPFYSTLFSGQHYGSFFPALYRKLSRIKPYHVIIIITFMTASIFIKNTTKSFIYKQMVFFGFFIMSIESLLILLYQSIAGSIYLRSSLIIFMFMTGAGLSSFFYEKFNIPRKGIFIFCNLIILTALLILRFNKLIFLSNVAILMTGVISGQVFPALINQLQKSEPGSCISHVGQIYSLDVLGGSLGVYLISMVIIPIWGFLIALIVVQLFTLAFTLYCFLGRQT